MENLCMRDVVKIDLNKGLSRTYAGMVLATGDNMANCFGAALYRGGDAVDITGYSVMGYFIRGGAETVVIQGKAEGNEAIVELPQACYTSDGGFSLAIKVSGADVTATVRVVDGAIRLTQTGTLIDPGDIVPSLDELFAKIAEMEAVTAEGEATIATIKADTAAAIKTTNEATAAANTATVELAKTAGVAITPTASGSIVSITDGADRPAVSLVSHIEPVQEGSGDPSPDNVRPISGWDSVTAQRAEKNLLRYPFFENNYTGNGMSITANSDGSVTFNGTPTGYAGIVLAYKLPIPKCKITIGIIGKASNYELDVSLLNKNGTTLKTFSFRQSATIDVNAWPSTVTVWIILKRADDNVATNWTAYPVVVVGDMLPTSYEPYQGQTLSTSLPETVYGGTLDWGTGVLTVKYHKIVLDGTQLFSANVATNNRFSALLERQGVYFEDDGAAFCDKLPFDVNTYYDGADNFGYIVHLGYLYIRFGSGSEVNSTDKLSEYFAANPATLVYKLATPYTIQLTPQQLETLKGTNNVWSDTGDTDLTYIADTQLYIDQKFSALETALLSTGANI